MPHDGAVSPLTYDRRVMTRPESGRRFAWALAAIVALAFAIRLVYILRYRQQLHFGGDAFVYHAGANLLADGKGFIWPFAPAQAIPTSAHPPLYMLYLAFPSVFGFTSVLTHLIWSAVLGTATVAIVALIGREVGGDRTGLVAGVLAAINSNLWVPDGSLMAESMAMFTTALAVYFSFRYWRDPRGRWLVWVGVAGGLGALSRSELVLLIPLLVIPLAVLAPGPSRRIRLRAAAGAIAAGVVVIAPWLLFNLTRFEKPELLSTQFGALLASTDCDLVWKGPTKSYYSVACADNVRKRSIPNGADESVQDAAYRRAGLDYVSNHLGELPGVVAARLGAIVGLYQPEIQINLDSTIEGRERPIARIGLYSFQALALLSVAGAIALRVRRQAPVFPLIVPVVTVVVTVTTGYASTRFRAPAEVVVCVLAAVALRTAASGFDRRRNKRRNMDKPALVI